MNLTVGIGDIVVTSNPKDTIVTHALGSCVAVTFHCNVKKMGAMIHIALPQRPQTHLGSSKEGYYAEDGLDLILRRLRKQNFNFNTADIYIVGGASPAKTNDFFMIGMRNVDAVREKLTKENLKYSILEVGGVVSRTVTLNVSNGSIVVQRQPLII